MSTTELVRMDAAKGVRFRDAKALDSDIRNLLEFDSYTEGEPVIEFKNGQLQVRCGECDELSEYAYTYGCWHSAGCNILAQHMVEGKMLLRVQTEGWPDDLYLISPGKAEKVDVARLLGF